MLLLILIYLSLYLLLSSQNIMVTVNVDRDVINKSYKAAMKARNDMLHYRNGKFYPKVCCLCDRFIPFDKEELISLINDLHHPNVKPHFWKDSFDWTYITDCSSLQHKLRTIFQN